MFSATVERDAFLSFLANNAVTENYHHWALTSDTFASNPKLLSFYNVISRNYDRKGVSFVSAFEAKDYPFYAVQFHPERPIFEWDPTEALDHSVRCTHFARSGEICFFLRTLRSDVLSFFLVPPCFRVGRLVPSKSASISPTFSYLNHARTRIHFPIQKRRKIRSFTTSLLYSRASSSMTMNNFTFSISLLDAK